MTDLQHGAIEAANSPISGPTTPSRVLVVDDDVQMVSLVRRLMARSGHESVGATSGEEALECLSTARFDLLITDITMGGLSGLRLLEAARRHDPDLAVIVVSGIDDPLTAESSLRGGAFGYVVKPFEVTELQIAVLNALRRRQLEIEQRRYLDHLETEVDRRTEQLRLASLEAKMQEQRFRSLAQASPLGIIYADRDNVLDYCNSSAEVLLGRSRPELSGRRWLDELDSPQRDLLEASIREAASGVPDTACEYQLRRPQGSASWIRSRIAPVLDDQQISRGVVVLFEDVGDRRRLESQLRHQASHDHLTGLPNRREFRHQLSSRLTELEPGQVLGVLLVDLDQFKLVNDTYGHEAGDQLIMTVGERLVECAPSHALVARLGGDEYVVALNHRSRHGVEATAELIWNALRQPVRILGVELSLSASIGISTTSEPHAAVSGLLRSADIALHHAKNRRNVIEVFDTSMAEDVARRLALTSDLRRAVDDELLTVHYQPMLDTATDRLVGLEALARWTHHERGEISPSEFIPIAESTGLVHRIDSQVLAAAVEQLARWRKSGRVHPDVFVSVNLSASQLSNSALPDLVQRTLARTGLDGVSLCIEVTEATLISDIDRAVPIMHRLRELGIRIAIDDFGTGHSALSYLGHLPLDVLKIDRSFVNAIGSGGIEVAEAIVDLAHRFDLEVVAEGVEEIYQLDRLRSLGCDMVQGFLLGRPTAPHHVSPALVSGSAEVGGVPGNPPDSPTTTRNEHTP